MATTPSTPVRLTVKSCQSDDSTLCTVRPSSLSYRNPMSAHPVIPRHFVCLPYEVLPWPSVYPPRNLRCLPQDPSPVMPSAAKSQRSIPPAAQDADSSGDPAVPPRTLRALFPGVPGHGCCSFSRIWDAGSWGLGGPRPQPLPASRISQLASRNSHLASRISPLASRILFHQGTCPPLRLAIGSL